MTDDTDDILYMKARFGYRCSFLTQTFGRIEVGYIICPKCKGILRDAVSMEGYIACFCCNSSPNFPVKSIRRIVNKLQTRCPVSDMCDWNGTLANVRRHVESCGEFRILCPLNCNACVERKYLSIHTKDECDLRIVQCQYCHKSMEFQTLQKHYFDCNSLLLQAKSEIGSVNADSPLADSVPDLQLIPPERIPPSHFLSIFVILFFSFLILLITIAMFHNL